MSAICDILKVTAGNWRVRIPDAAAACYGA